MKTRHAILFAAVAVILCSCIPSISPFYMEKDRVFDPALLGEWQSKSDSDEEPGIWKFENFRTNAYKLTIIEKKGKEGIFDANLFKLKQDYFLDLIPAACDYPTNQADMVKFSMSPGHLLVRVQIGDPTFKLTFMDFDWLGKYLEKNPDALAHRAEPKHIVLTASTRDLQRFVLKHVNDLFKEPGEMTRRTPAPTPPGN